MHSSAPNLSSTDWPFNSFLFPQNNVHAQNGQQLSFALGQSNVIDDMTGLGGHSDLAFSSCPGFEIVNLSGLAGQSGVAASTNESDSIIRVHTMAANTKNSNRDRIFCMHEGCSVTFGRASDFRRHLKKHSGPEYQCSFENCGRQFYRRDKLRDHQRKMHAKTAQSICKPRASSGMPRGFRRH
jgi:hypothetical protein